MGCKRPITGTEENHIWTFPGSSRSSELCGQTEFPDATNVNHADGISRQQAYHSVARQCVPYTVASRWEMAIL